MAPASPHLRIAGRREWEKSGRVVRNRRRREYIKRKQRNTRSESRRENIETDSKAGKRESSACSDQKARSVVAVPSSGGR